MPGPKHSEQTDVEGLHLPKGWSLAASDVERVIVRKTDGSQEYRDISMVGATGPAGPAGTATPVIPASNLGAPDAELATESGATDGDLIVVYQATAGINPVSIYSWDSTSNASVDSPRVVSGSGGQWHLVASTNSTYKNLFDTSVDDSDDITEGSTNLYLQGTELSNVVEDTTPQLGGDLDMNSQELDGPVPVDGQAYSKSVALTDQASISTNCDLANVFTVTLAGNRTLANPTNLQAGATYIWVVTQDGAGSRTLSYGSAFKFPGGTAPTLTTTGGAVDIVTGVSDGTNVRCVFQGDFQ